MNTLTKNRIIEKGDEYRDKGGAWKPVPKDDIGLQIMFTKYAEVRRPSEKPPKHKPSENGNVVLTPARRPTDWKEEMTAAINEKNRREVEEIHKREAEAAVIDPEAHGLPTVISRRAHKHGETVDPTKAPLPAVTPETAAKEGLEYLKKLAKGETPTFDPTGPAPFPKGPIEKAVEAVTAAVSPTPPVGITAPSPAKITWPATEPECQWIGRNGTFKCRGVNIYKNGKGVIKIVPVGKRGIAKNAEIEFPVNAIPQVVDFLTKQYIAGLPK